MTKAIASKNSTPEVIEKDVVVLPQSEGLSLIMASDRVRTNAEKKVTHLLAETAAHGIRAERSLEALVTEYMRVRRMFPAVDSVREILGDDAPDLAGRSPEYKAALKRMNEGARDDLIAALRSEGFTAKLAIAHADAELESLRKSISRGIRIAVEEEARALLKSDGREAAARFILGHGFGYSGEVPGGAEARVIQAKSWMLKDGQLQLPEGKVISENGRDVVDAVQQGQPQDSSDEVPAGDTADNDIAEKVNGAVVDPNALINEAVGMLRTAAELIAKNPKGMTKAQRTTHRKNVLSAARTLIGELEATLSDTANVETGAVTAS